MPATKAAVFTENVLLGDGVGSTATPGSYFGFGQSGSSAASTGPRMQAGSGNPNGVVTSPIGSHWTDSVTGILYLNTNGGTAWTVIGSSGAMWSPLVAQNPLNAKTDYFNGPTLDPKWGFWNPGALTTVSTSAATRLKLTQATHAGQGIAGIYQTPPASARYNITGYVNVSSFTQGFGGMNVFVAGDIVGAPTTAPVSILEQVPNPGPNLNHAFSNFTAYNAFSGTSVNASVYGRATMLVRIHVDTVGTNYHALVSPDGYSWTKLIIVAFAATTVGAAPTYIGMGVNNLNTSEDVVGYSPMFRVDATSDPYEPCGAFA